MPPESTRKSKTQSLESEQSILDASTLPTPALDSNDLRMSYRIARGEQGVLTFEPYKSLLLPYWRFKTVPIAENSSVNLKAAFDYYVKAGDLVGADMARKFIQMGMTRAKRYANHKGGRKYNMTKDEAEASGKSAQRKELPKSQGHAGQDEKLAVSELFKKIWRTCMADAEYLELRGLFQEEQKEWDRAQKTKPETDKLTGQMVGED